VGTFLAGKRVLVLGGWGLVGSAICRELLREEPAQLLVHSLRPAEAGELDRELRASSSGASLRVLPLHGNIFLPLELTERSRRDLLNEPGTRARLLDEIYGELTPAMVEGSTLFAILQAHRPHIIVDCINTATALAYQNLYESVDRLRDLLRAGPEAPELLLQVFEEQLGALHLPQLIRHVQILFECMQRSGTETYLKIGTTGTGGMGLNVPYTHSEERPSRLLLSKAAVAGAHSMLLFLMGSTPGGPVVKEIKPAAAVAWKRIGRGPVLRGGRPIPLFDCPMEQAMSAADALAWGSSPIDSGPEAAGTGAANPPARGAPASVRAQRPDDVPGRRSSVPWRPLDEGAILEAAFIDTGENGMFALAEFETVTSLGQMEFVTPEEIARHVLLELEGGGTGRDVVTALAGASLGPSYRAGYLRQSALARLSALDSEESPSVAFEMLGPPRLSKLLWEAHLLHRVCRPFVSLVESSAETLSRELQAVLEREPGLRARILSIGLAILLPDGRMLRGPNLKTPASAGQRKGLPDQSVVEAWARAGWVDLRPVNVERWQARLRAILSTPGPAPEHSSLALSEVAWEAPPAYSPGKLAAWILAREDGGRRRI
jgi:hypothetical protein